MNVVLAADGTPGARLAQAVLEKLPLASGTPVNVANVVGSPVPVEVGVALRALAYPSTANLETWKKARSAGQKTVESSSDSLSRAGLKPQAAVIEGSVADALLKLAQDEGAKLIVAGSGESSDFAAFFLGSVSRKLALNSEASILVGRRYEDRTAEESIDCLISKPKLDVLVAIDGSPGSRFAIDTLRPLAKPVFGRILLLAVEPSGSWTADPALPIVPLVEPDSHWSEELLRQAAHEVRSSCDKVEWLVGFGRPSVEIARAAKLHGTDLVMLGANRHSSLERWLLGSCAYETATSAPCSVLILRDRLDLQGSQNR